MGCEAQFKSTTKLSKVVHTKLTGCIGVISSELLHFFLFWLLVNGSSVLSIPLVSLLDFDSTHGEFVDRGRPSHHLYHELVDVRLAEAAAHRGKHLLVGRDRHRGWVAEAKVHLSLEVKLVTGLEPEENEGLTAVVLGHLEEGVQISVPLLSVAFVNVWQEGNDTDDLSLALVIILLLSDELVHIWLNVGLVE